MLVEALTALAAAGGTAVVQAAGTDVWGDFRQRVAGWFGRGDAQREHEELERLDQTVAVLTAADSEELQRVRDRQEAAWQARFEMLLEGLDQDMCEQAAARLRALLAEYTPAGGTSAGPGGLAVGGNVDIRADRGSVATGVLHGGAHIGPPPAPDPSQG
ncbi:hypothetical protein AS594_35720 [Streptomyces agglomeratus]|uniref:Uncharacterized protein n=1 Tax=Streptomyces agglomeratus TaxID=285458 RepID=A0A1E5PHJ1_9ACTN|nr:hypothetical protein AS594_35720 [Streptomyces agglomeratus]